MTVTQKQCLLTFLGYDTGGLDGIWGPKSRNATEQVQEDLGIPVDGVWGSQTETAVLEAVYTYDVDAPVPEQDTGANETTVVSFWPEIVYFKREEMRCKCGGRYCNGFPAEPQQLLMELADRAREYFGRPAHVVSGLRCSRWNAIQGGVANSQHMYGEAMDIYIEGITADQLLAWMKKQPEVRYCCKINSTNVHFDIPKGKR